MDVILMVYNVSQLLIDPKQGLYGHYNEVYLYLHVVFMVILTRLICTYMWFLWSF